MQVFKCDLCGEVSDYNMHGEKEYCGNCNTIIYKMENDAYMKVRKELSTRYDQTTRNLANVLRLAEWFWVEQPEEYTKVFGTQGYDLLKKALEK